MSTQRTHRKRHTEKQIIEALNKSGGVIATAAEALGMYRESLSHRVHGNARLKAALDESRESLVDLAESSLIELIEARNVQAVLFALRCQGRGRGWVERTTLAATVEASIHATCATKAEDMACALGIHTAIPEHAEHPERFQDQS